jgi:hypothetical protein
VQLPPGRCICTDMHSYSTSRFDIYRNVVSNSKQITSPRVQECLLCKTFREHLNIFSGNVLGVSDNLLYMILLEVNAVASIVDFY